MRIIKSSLIVSLALAFVLSGCLAGDDPPESGDAGLDGQGEAHSNETGNQTTGEVVSTTVGWSVGITGCATFVGLHLMAFALEDIDFAAVTIPSEAQGGAFNATFSSTVPALEWGIAFWAGEDLAEAFFTMDATMEGTVPESADTAQIFSCGGVDLSADFTVTA